MKQLRPVMSKWLIAWHLRTGLWATASFCIGLMETYWSVCFSLSPFLSLALSFSFSSSPFLIFLLSLSPSCQRLDSLTNHYSLAPPEGGQWESSGETLSCVYMPDSHAVQVPMRRDHTVADVVSLACKVRVTEGIVMMFMFPKLSPVSVNITADIALIWTEALKRKAFTWGYALLLLSLLLFKNNSCQCSHVRSSNLSVIWPTHALVPFVNLSYLI